jgi:fumarate hydratase class II
MRPVMVMTLIDANMNSHSPYTPAVDEKLWHFNKIFYEPAPKKLMTTTTKRKMVTQTALLTDLFQKLMRMAAALNSVGKMIVLPRPEMR